MSKQEIERIFAKNEFDIGLLRVNILNKNVLV